MTAQDIFDRFAAEAGDIAMKPSEALALINFTIQSMQEPEVEEEHEEKKTKRKK